MIHVTIPVDHPAKNNTALCDPKEKRALERDNTGGVTLYRLDPGNPAAYRERRKRAIAEGEDICSDCDARAGHALSRQQPDVPRANYLLTDRPVCTVCRVYGEEGQSLAVVREFNSPIPNATSNNHWPAGMVGKVVREGQPRSGGHVHLALAHPHAYGATACLCVVGYRMRPVQSHPVGPTKTKRVKKGK